MTAPALKAQSDGSILRGLVLSRIDTCPCVETQRLRIDVAEEAGLITAGEAAEKRAIAQALATMKVEVASA